MHITDHSLYFIMVSIFKRLKLKEFHCGLFHNQEHLYVSAKKGVSRTLIYNKKELREKSNNFC